MSAVTGRVPEPLTGVKLWTAAMCVAIGSLLVVLDITIANVSVPHIAGSLGASASQGTWVITTYAASEAICMPLTGWLARRYGSVRTFTGSMIGFTIASALCGMAGSLPALLLFRVLQGLCGAPLLPLCQTLMLRIFPASRASTAVAVTAMISVLAPLGGPIVGGYITDHFSWRWIFYLNLPLAALSIPMTARMLAPFETPRTIEPIDKIGLALLVIWVGSLQLMLDMGRDRDWFDSPLINGLAIAAAVGFIAFLIWELTEPTPIVDLHVLRHRGFWASVISLSLVYGTMMAGNVIVPLWAQLDMGYTATQAGYILTPTSIFSLVCVPLVGRLMTRVDPRILVTWGILWMGCVSLIRVNASTDLDTLTIALPQLLQGFANAFFFIGLTVMALGSVLPSEVAAAAGLMSFLRTMATATAVSWATTTWDDHTQHVRTELAAAMNGGQDVMTRLVHVGLSDVQARIILERLVETQSATLSFGRVYLMIGLLCVALSTTVWIIPKPKKPAK